MLLQPKPADPGGVKLLPGADLLLDERRLRQVLDNLLSNANRYTLGGTLTLKNQLGVGTTFTLQLNCPVGE